MNMQFNKHSIVNRIGRCMVPSPYESVNQYPWVPDEATSEHKTLVEEVIGKLNEAPNITYLEKASGWVVSKRLVMKYAQVGSK